MSLLTARDVLENRPTIVESLEAERAELQAKIAILSDRLADIERKITIERIGDSTAGSNDFDDIFTPDGNL